MRSQEYNYTIPVHFITALVNSDRSGLNSEDEQALDNFLQSLPEGEHSWDFGEDQEEYYPHGNDVYGLELGCGCYNATLTVFTPEN